MSRKRAILTTMTACLALSFVPAFVATPVGQAAPRGAVLSVLHFATGDDQAAVVDVFADQERIMNNVQVGQLRAVRMTPGTFNIGIYTDGSSPGNGTPLLNQPTTSLAKGANLTLALYRDAMGVITAQNFDNAALRNPRGEGRLTIRHIAVAPEVDVRIEGQTVVFDLANSEQAALQVPAGTRLLELLQSSDQQVLLSARQISINRPMNTILYVWGSTQDGLRLASQRVQVGSVKRQR